MTENNQPNADSLNKLPDLGLSNAKEAVHQMFHDDLQKDRIKPSSAQAENNNQQS